MKASQRIPYPYPCHRTSQSAPYVSFYLIHTYLLLASERRRKKQNKNWQAETMIVIMIMRPFCFTAPRQKLSQSHISPQQSAISHHPSAWYRTISMSHYNVHEVINSSLSPQPHEKPKSHREAPNSKKKIPNPQSPN